MSDTRRSTQRPQRHVAAVVLASLAAAAARRRRKSPSAASSSSSSSGSPRQRSPLPPIMGCVGPRGLDGPMEPYNSGCDCEEYSTPPMLPPPATAAATETDWTPSIGFHPHDYQRDKTSHQYHYHSPGDDRHDDADGANGGGNSDGTRPPPPEVRSSSTASWAYGVPVDGFSVDELCDGCTPISAAAAPHLR